MDEYQFLIGINDDLNNNDNLNVPVLNPKIGIDIYFMTDYIVYPFCERHGAPIILDLEVKICLLNLTLLNDLLLNNSLSNLTISDNATAGVETTTTATTDATATASENTTTTATASENTTTTATAGALSITEIEKKIRCPFTIILNSNGLESPIIINSVVYNKDYNNNIKLYIHNLSDRPYIFRKNTSIFQLIMNNLNPTTMKIININDPIFN
jgi:dUTPase